MKKGLLVSLLMTAGLCSCIDSDYDLSDIDTTARIPVNNLTIPVRLDAITLDDMLDLKEGDQIKKSSDGLYVFQEKGTFNSSAIKVNKFTANGIGKTVSTTFNISYNANSNAFVRGASSVTISASIPHEKTTFDFEANGVDKYIVDIIKLGTETTLNMSMKFVGLTSTLKSIHLRDIEMQFLKGLTLTPSKGTYNPETGIIKLANAETDGNHCFTLSLSISAIDMAKAGGSLNNGKFKLHGDLEVLNGYLEGSAADLQPTASLPGPSSADFYLEAASSDIVVNEFTGNIKYDIENVNIEPISLNNLPDILSQTGTNISLENPELTITVNNPIIEAGHQVYAQMGLSFLSNMNTYAIAADAIKMQKAQNAFVLSPKKENLHADTNLYEWVEFQDMGKILNGEKMPNMITVNVLSPCIPTQYIENFKLGNPLNKINGTWEFYTPLSLTEDSRIKYVKEWDDWQDKDLNGLTISDAEVTAELESNVALDLEIDVTFLGRDGQLKGTAIAPAGQTDFKVSLTGTTISKIYGAKIEARAKGTGKSLSPDQTIKLSNLKAKVNGYYEREL